jgi:NTE family protein
VSATNVWNGKVRVFEEKDVTAEAVMASACLPDLFQAVEIDGVPYWDGGFMGNPSLFPFFEKTRSEDIVLVQINPVERAETPRTARDILNRIDEITFNASLLRECMHRIAADEALKPLSASSKSNTEWQFLKHLRDIGRAAALDWLDLASDKVGMEPGIDLAEETAYSLVSPRDHPPATPRVRDMLAKMRGAVGWKSQEQHEG